MWNAVLKRLVFAVLILSCAASVIAQTRRQAKPEFRILSVGNMNVTSADECEALKFIRVLVPRRASEKSLELSSKAIASTYRKEIDLMVFFFTSRKAARRFLDWGSEEEEKSRSRAVRGLYSRSKGGSIERVMFFPLGLTEDDLAQLEPREDN